MGCSNSQAAQAKPPPAATGGGDAKELKIKNAKTYFHPDSVFGVAKPDWMASDSALNAVAEKYAKNLESLPDPEPILSLFAEGASWTDPVGGKAPPYVGKDAIKELLGKIPKVPSSKLVETFYSASGKIFCCKTEVTMEGQNGQPPAILMNVIELDDDNKIKKAETYFHADCAFGAPKPEWMPTLNAFAEKHAKSLESLPETEPITSLFAEGASWTDPVGGEAPPYVGKDAMKKLLAEIPKVKSSKLVETFYSESDKIFCCKTEVLMERAVGPAILMNVIELA